MKLYHKMTRNNNVNNNKNNNNNNKLQRTRMKKEYIFKWVLSNATVP